jgi:hypothetical protein
MGGHRISPRSCPDQPVVPGALSTRHVEEAGLKKAEEVMEILEAFDLAGSLRGAAELCGCDHKTVAHWVLNAPDPTPLRPTASATSGPSTPHVMGRTHGRQWGEEMAAGGENRWPYLGRNRWPLTRGQSP